MFHSPSYTFVGYSPQSFNNNFTNNTNNFQPYLNYYSESSPLLNTVYTPKEEIKYVCNYDVQIENEDKFRITKRIIGNSVNSILNLSILYLGISFEKNLT